MTLTSDTIDHALRLLSFLSAIEKDFDKILRLENQVRPMVTQVTKKKRFSIKI
jgi:hypothetical protein